MLSQIGRGDRTYQPPQRVSHQANGDHEQGCWAPRLAAYLPEGAIAVSRSGGSTVKCDIDAEVGDQ